MRVALNFKIFLAASVLSAVVFAGVAQAQVTPGLMLSDDAMNVVTIDSAGNVTFGGNCNVTNACSGTSTNAGTGVINWAGRIGNFQVTVLGNYLVLPDTQQRAFDLNISNLMSTGPGTLTVQYTATGLSIAPAFLLNASSNWQTGSGNVTYSSFVDPSNTPFNTTGTAQLIGTIGPIAFGTSVIPSDNVMIGPSGAAVSATSVLTFMTDGAGANFSSDYFLAGAPFVSSTCSTINAIQNVPITPVTIAPTGGVGPYFFSVTGLPASLMLSSMGPGASTTVVGTPTQSGTFPYTVTIMDSGDSNNTSTANCTANVTPPSNPGMMLTKTASPTTVTPFQLVTYTYTVTNTGGITLTNIVVTDDNATPTDRSDDFVVGTIASLAPGNSATLTWTTYPTMNTVVLDQKLGVIPGGTLSIQNVQSNGCSPNVNCPIKVTFNQAITLNDNCYGTPASSATGGPACVGWGNGHKFSDLTGSDNALFDFYDGKGNLVLQFNADYISQASAPAALCPNTSWTSYPSGYGSLGSCGGDGKFGTGTQSWILSSSSTLTDSINSAGFTSGFTTNSPAQNTPGWNFVDGYSVVISAAAFGGNGFGSVSIPNVHNSPSKNGTDQVFPTPTSSVSTNTATAVATGGVTASASASVTINSSIQPTSVGGGGAPGGSQTGGAKVAKLAISYPGANGTQGGNYNVTPNIQGGKKPFTCSISAGSLPPGLSLNPSSGAITGNPNGQGKFSISVSVADSSNQIASQTFTISIAPPPPLGIRLPPLGGANVGKPFNATLAATGGIPPYSFAITAGTLPAGLTLNANTGIIGGIPTATVGGPAASLTFTVTDSAGKSASQNAALNVGPAAPLNVALPGLGGANVGKPYSVTIGATGGVQPYTFSITGPNSLPNGLALNPNTGVISGIPTATVGGPAATLTFTVTDNSGKTASQNAALNVGNK